MKRFTYLLLLLSPLFAFSQKRLDLVHNNAFAFYDYQEKAFCVLDDSTFIWKYNARKEKWEKSPIELRIDSNLTFFLNEFVPLFEKCSPVYFVHAGCGVIYKKNGKKIHRHDHSFYHRNQFNGAYFLDKGEPHIYGGYGLFSCKNLMTRYDMNEREWYGVQSIGLRPPPGIYNIVQKYKGSYFLFDGLKEVNGVNYPMQNVWKFDTRTNHWSMLGRLNPEILGSYFQNNLVNRSFSESYIAVFDDKIVKYNFKNLKFKKYPLKSIRTYAQIIQVGNQVLLFRNISNKRYIEIADNDFWKKFSLEYGSIVIKEDVDSTVFFRFFLILLFVLLILLFFHHTRKYRKKKNRKNKLSDFVFLDFSPTEKELLRIMKDRSFNGLEISSINDLVGHDQPSIDTLKKRRELLLKDLRIKLAAKFNIPQEDVFIERRMETDKRMKLLFLNESILDKI